MPSSPLPPCSARNTTSTGVASTASITAAKPLGKHYDVVIIGAGGHGAAIAYYLARHHGITNVALLDKAYLGGGNTARNTAVIRSNYLTPEGVAFYRESVRLFQGLSNELGYNIMLEDRGQLTLAHSDAAIRGFRWRAEVNQHLGVRSELVDRQTIRELVPNLRMDDDMRYPVLAGLWHADGGTARHDAVVWGYAREACRRPASTVVFEGLASRPLSSVHLVDSLGTEALSFQIDETSFEKRHDFG